MPLVKVHCAISKKRTKGNDFRKLHEWIDVFHKEMGIEHRMKRHALNTKDRDFILEKWGEKGVVEWLFHVAIDNLDTAFREARKCYGKNAYNFFKFGLLPDSRFIYLDFDRKDKADLEKEFKDAYEDD